MEEMTSMTSHDKNEKILKNTTYSEYLNLGAKKKSHFFPWEYLEVSVLQLNKH